MAMSALSIATSALTASQAALQVAGNNIANVNTAGYSRQGVELKTAGYQQTGTGFMGQGVAVTTVKRAYNDFVARETLVTAAQAAADNARLDRLKQLEAVFPMGSTGLGSALNSALNAWADVATQPSDATAKGVVIESSRILANRFNQTSAQLSELQRTAEDQRKSAVADVNRLAADIASLNKAIVGATVSGHAPNDLLDQRDQALSELNQRVRVSTVGAADGSVTVMMAGSQPLVLGNSVSQLSLQPDGADPTQMRLAFTLGGQTTVVPDAALGGGELAGLQTFLADDVTAAQNQLGRLAVAAAWQVNTQQALGLRADGTAGGSFSGLDNRPSSAFFTTPTLPGGLPYPGTAGSVAVDVTNPTELQASDYKLERTSAGWNVSRLSDGLVRQVADLSAPIDGLRFTDTGTAVGGQFLVRPFAQAGRDMSMAISSAAQVATASSVKVTPSAAAWSGQMQIESVYATQPDANAASPITLTFAANGSYTIGGAAQTPALPSGPQSYSPGEPIVINGWSLTLRGAPAAGDSLVVSPPAVGDSVRFNAGNAQAMLALRDAPSFDGYTLADGYVALFSDMGSRVRGAQFAQSFSQGLADAAATARSSVQGVNLDEEAARLLQHQQSYQAAARFMQMAQGTFDTLLQSLGR